MPDTVRQSENESFGLREYLEAACENPGQAAKEIGGMILLFLVWFFGMSWLL